MVLLLNDDIEHIGVNPMFSHLSSEMGGLLFHWRSFLKVLDVDATGCECVADIGHMLA